MDKKGNTMRSLSIYYLLLAMLNMVLANNPYDLNHEVIPDEESSDSSGFIADSLSEDSDDSSELAPVNDYRRKSDLKVLKRSFKNLDRLFGQAQILVEILDEDKKILSSRKTTLEHFLKGPSNKRSIISLLKKHLNSRYYKACRPYLSQFSGKSVMELANFLFDNNIIDVVSTRNIIVKSMPMSPKETIRLIENGICHTKTGYLVKLRTGEVYGDALSLNGKIARAVQKLGEKHGVDYNNTSVLKLMTSSYKEELAEILDEMNLAGKLVISDSIVLSHMRQSLIFLSTIGLITWFNPGGDDAGVAVDRENRFNASIVPNSLSALITGNHYLGCLDGSTSYSLSVDPLGLSYSGSFVVDNQGADWWLFYSDGYLGGGGSYTVNFDNNALWSNGEASYLTFGGFISGWDNRLSAGISLQTLLAGVVGVGVNAAISVSKSHDVTYLGEYALDGKISSIRGLKKIEINDRESVGVKFGAAGSFAPASIPLGVAFKANKSCTMSRIYRTHTDLIEAQEFMDSAKVPGILIAVGKKIKKNHQATFDKPEDLQEGDELVEVKSGTLTGAFVLGLNAMVPISGVKLGGNVEMVAEFELGLKKQPNNKYEISIEPKRVHEMSIFGGVLNILGAGKVKGMAMARKQIFMFDFNHQEAKQAYFNLVHYGRMPTTQEIEIYTDDRGPEHLLAEFRAQNEKLLRQGVQRTFLEKVTMDTNKDYVGIRAPVINAVLEIINKLKKYRNRHKESVKFTFDGVDREFLTSNSKSISTNGIVAVRTSTNAMRKSKGQAFSGRYNEDIFVTHRRIHALDITPSNNSENRWQFDSLILHAQIEDTKITDNEENVLADKIGKMFGTFFGSFDIKNSKSPRIVNIERTITKKDLDTLSDRATVDMIGNASAVTNISPDLLRNLIENLRNKHPDRKALLVKEFIEEQKGVLGFAAIHQLLGSHPKDLFIHTESGYMSAVKDAENFIMGFVAPDDSYRGGKINLLPEYDNIDPAHIRKFFDGAQKHLQIIDKQLHLLHDDKYLLDEYSHLNSVLDQKQVEKLIKLGVRQGKSSTKSTLISLRNTILKMLDLKKQNLTNYERMLLYKAAGKAHLGLVERSYIYVQEINNKPLSLDLGIRELIKKFNQGWKLINEIDEKIYELKNDQTMHILDGNYIIEQAYKLAVVRNHILNLIDLNSMSNSGLLLIKKKLSNRKKNMKTKKLKELLEIALIKKEIPLWSYKKSDLGFAISDVNYSQITDEVLNGPLFINAYAKEDKKCRKCSKKKSNFYSEFHAVEDGIPF